MKKMNRQLSAILLAAVMIISFAAAPLFAVDAPTYKDVPQDAWYQGYVMMLDSKGIVKGFGTTGEFRPDRDLTREQAAKMATLAAGLVYRGKKADFPDVDEEGEMSPYIAALQDKGAIQGFPDGTYRPFANIERGHAAKIVALAFGLFEGDMVQVLTDLPQDAGVKAAIEILESNGVVKGYGDTRRFKPGANMTRAEFSKVLCIAMVVTAIQKAEWEPSSANLSAAQTLLDQLPRDQDRPTQAYLQGRLSELGEEAERPNQVSAVRIQTEPADTRGLDNEAGPVTVTMSTATPGAEIYYTGDGSTPSSKSHRYTAPFTLSNTGGYDGETFLIKAIGIKAGMDHSAVTTRRIVYRGTHMATVTTAEEFVTALEHKAIDTINLAGDIAGDVTATRAGNRSFTIEFGPFLLTGDLDLTAHHVADITLKGVANPSILGDLTVSAGMATVTNNILVQGEVTIADVGDNSWIERADGNRITLTDSNGAQVIIYGDPEAITVTETADGGIKITAHSPVTITVDAGATVDSITATGGAAGTTIINNGTLTSVTANTDISIENNFGQTAVTGSGTVAVSGAASGSVTGETLVTGLTDLAIEPAALRMGDTESATITGIPGDAAGTYNVTSANPEIVSVTDPAGLGIRAVKTGRTAVTVQVMDGEDKVTHQGAVLVLVGPELITEASIRMVVPVQGQTPQQIEDINSQLLDADYTVTNIVWKETLIDGQFQADLTYRAEISLMSLNNKAFAEELELAVDGAGSVGEAQRVGEGVGNRVTFEAIFPVTAQPGAVPVSGVRVDNASETLMLQVGDDATLMATISPSNATNKTITWTSSDEGVASVDANGQVSGVDGGYATITARTEDGGFTATKHVVVGHVLVPAGTGIQEAIDTSAEGAVIAVAPGGYQEQLVIDKALTLLGPNAGIAGYGKRNAEAVIGANERLGTTIRITSTDVTVDGLTVEGGEEQLNGIYFKEIYAEDKMVNITIKNNRVLKFGSQGPSADKDTRYDEWGRGIYIANGDTKRSNAHYIYGIAITGNYVQYAEGGIVLKFDSYAHIADNLVEDCHRGIHLHWFGIATDGRGLDEEYVEYHMITNNQVVIGDEFGWNESTGFAAFDQDTAIDALHASMGIHLNCIQKIPRPVIIAKENTVSARNKDNRHAGIVVNSTKSSYAILMDNVINDARDGIRIAGTQGSIDNANLDPHISQPVHIIGGEIYGGTYGIHITDWHYWPGYDETVMDCNKSSNRVFLDGNIHFSGQSDYMVSMFNDPYENNHSFIVKLGLNLVTNADFEDIDYVDILDQDDFSHVTFDTSKDVLVVNEYIQNETSPEKIEQNRVVIERLVASNGDKCYPCLQAAIDDAEEGDTILLGTDLLVSDTATIDKSITLDLNGHNLTTPDSTGSAAKTVLKITGPDVTIKGGGLIKSGTTKNYSGFGSETINLQNVSTNLTIKDGVTVKGGDSINSYQASSAIWFWSTGTLTFENAQVIGGDQIKRSVDHESGYQNAGTAGDAINVEMANSATINIIAGSTVKGGDGINDGHGPISGDDEYKKATGGLAFSRHPGSDIHIADSTVLGGKSELWAAESAIEMGTGNVTITNSMVKGGDGDKDGGDAIHIVSNSSGKLTIISSELSGGDGGTSWLGCGIQYRKAIELAVTNSIIYGGDATGSGKGFGNALYMTSSVATNKISIIDTTLELTADPEKVYGKVAISKSTSLDVAYDMVALLDVLIGEDNYTIENNGAKVIINSY